MSQNLPVLREEISRMQPEFQKALPGHIPVEKFMRTINTALSLKPALQKADAQSLLAACTNAATDGLILDGREAALVVDKDGKVQYRPMVNGIMKKARNSGQLASLHVHVVHEKDRFAYVLGDDERIEHEPCINGDPGAPVAVYAIARLKDGSVQREVMTVAAVNKIRDRSDGWKALKAGKIKSSPWQTDWEEMARKTVIRRISKYLPSSSDRDDFQRVVERIDEDFTFEDGIEPTIAPDKNHVRKKRGGAAAALKDITPRQPETNDASTVVDHDPETGEVYDSQDDDPI